ncbi:hypothetical protein E4U53_001803 [Claviceps sorghi]|nr:hypothetical protein E4U53_001803 [Claviceps sorghi]
MGLYERVRLSQRAIPSDGVSGAPTSSVGDPAQELRNFSKQHKWDPFLDIDKLQTIESAIDSDNTEKQVQIDQELIQEDSPYLEVRSSVPPSDDPDMPVNTIRAWFLGSVLCTVTAACNVLLSMHRSSASITSIVVQLVAYPLGVGLANVLPNKEHHVLGFTFNLNPGPFNVKEHTIITMMTAAGSSFSYAIDILLAQEVFYQQRFGWGFQILLVVSTQAMGFGVAGIARRYLVWPSSMVWPANLVTCTIMYSLHKHMPSDMSRTNGWKISRYRFFLLVSLSAFVYHWIPEVFAQFLSIFTFACWVAPQNVVVNQLFGAYTGLGLIPITFDWMTVSSWLNSPLQTPLFAIVNVGFGFVICILGSIGLAYAGPEYYKYLPLSDAKREHGVSVRFLLLRRAILRSANRNWDRYAKAYNTSRILTAEYTVNETAYEEYSPILLGATFSLSYCMSFATLASTIAHCALFYGGDIWRRARRYKSEEADVHMKLMRKYREAPEWWFATVFAISFAFGMISSQVWKTHLPWWAYLLCIIIALVFFIPVGIVQAVTNQQPGLNIITEMIIGYMLPGRPVAMMLFKSWGYMTAAHGLIYISDMKIGHYMKIPPRSMFAAQAFAVFWLSMVQISTYNFLMGNITGICTDEQAEGLTCPNAVTFYNASVIWGVIGPKRVFGAGGLYVSSLLSFSLAFFFFFFFFFFFPFVCTLQLIRRSYSWTNWFWLIGIALPLMQYLVARRFPRSFARYIIWPAIFSAPGLVPPATLYYMLPWVVVGVVFNGWIRRRYLGWWNQYNYVLSGGLDIGARLCVVIVALGLGVGNANFPDWWGNRVMMETLDYTKKAVTRRFVPNVTEPIGPAHWMMSSTNEEDPFLQVQQDVLAQLSSTRPLFASYLRIRSLSTDPSSPELASARSDLEASLASLAEDLTDLVASVQAIESSPSQYGISPAEAARRKRLVEEVGGEIQDMREELASRPAAAPARPGMPDPRASVADPDPDPDPDDADAYAAFEHQQQLGMLREQDEHLDGVSQTVGNLRRQAGDMGRELEQQSEMLHVVDETVERVSGRLQSGMQKLQHVMRRNEDRWSGYCIGVLIFVLILLLFLLVIL